MKKILLKAWSSVVTFLNGDEVKSFITTFIVIFAIDATSLLTQLYQGDWSSTMWHGLGIAIARTIVKVILTVLFPSLFPKRTS